MEAQTTSCKSHVINKIGSIIINGSPFIVSKLRKFQILKSSARQRMITRAKVPLVLLPKPRVVIHLGGIDTRAMHVNIG